MMLEENQLEPMPLIDLASPWGANLEAAMCETCDRSYLTPQQALPLLCPHCWQSSLTPVSSLPQAIISESPYNHPPELLAPFTVTTDHVAQSIQNFARGIWFAPGDLTPQNLNERLQPIYAPMWLVDSQVQAIWQAEAGFNYQAVSHQDQFDENRGGWSSHQITETRIRWEPRVGRLERTYHNIPAPALEEHAEFGQKLGSYDLAAAHPYKPEALAQALIRLPDRSTADAWPDTIPAFQAEAAGECRQACQADHWREFRWTAQYQNQNWTLLLLPMWSTYYLDDAQNPQPVLIHGQSGQLHGVRRASMQRAKRTAMMITGVAIVIFILSLIIALVALIRPALGWVAGVGLAIAFIIGLLSLLPIIIVWQFNRTHG